MNNFMFQMPTKYVFGKDSHKGIGELVKPYADKVLLVYGGGSIKRNGLYDDVIASLNAQGVAYVELSGVQANPRYEKVLEGIELVKKENLQLILAVGGGSVIDTAKAIAMCIGSGDVWACFSAGAKLEAALPVATILTIPAAGSEVSPDAVISYKGRKLGFSSQKIRPVVSVVNPDIFKTLPKNQIANGVCDMMSHIFERYFTQTQHTDLIDSLAEATLKTIMRNALLLMRNPADYEAWTEVSLAGSVAHNGFLGCGRVQDWGCHAMEHELSAQDEKVAHGAGLAVLTPAWMRYVYSENPKMFYQFAVNVMDIKPDRDEEKVILAGIDKLAAFFKSLGQPNSLQELGFSLNAPLEEMAKKCSGEGFVGNFKPLYWKDVLSIYKACL
ncbi:MAG: iron-containing alcohol dehydrogenase [Paludibacteraceae bacterium]|nr:iron-containing alcohol dehydrogenase [Paludibacteraceae bacterium]